MTYLNRSRWGLGLMALMLLTVGLAGCGSEPAAVATPPAPPPAPPPFQPVAVEVALGANGGTVTLMTTEAGGHTLNGEAFASGTEVEGNGSTYTLTLDGTWSAAYKPPPAMSLALGTTGGELMIERLEDGSYQANGVALASGDTVTAENGNMYTVTISDDGTPSEAYVVPAALSIPLGLSGDTVAIVKNEDGTYSVNGEVLTADTRVMAANGNVYGALLAPDGTPIGVMHIAAMQEVMLGELGGTITLTQAEDKSWWLGEMAVMDGDEYMAANGNTYTLVSDGTTWSAAYTQPPAMSLALGTTGGELMIERLENGSYQANGAALASGDTVTATNGNMYTVTISDDGTPSAAYVVPAALSIPLGLSGDTAAIVKNEDGTYSVDGEVLTADTEVMAENGNVYGALLAPDGTPAAEAMYIAAMQEVTLGELGGTITLKQGEDKAWWLGEMAVMDGDEYMAANGNTYTLMMDEAGTWSGMYQAVERSFDLGTQGSITLTRAEDMSWSMDDGMVVMDGDEHTADNGNMYTLSMTDGEWFATFVPVGMDIAGTGLTAYTREAADAMYTVGGSDDTLTDGVGDVTADGAMYHVWRQDDDTLAGARFDAAINGGTDFILGDLDAMPTLTADDEDTAGNELRTGLKVAGETFPLAELLGAGTSTQDGDNFVAEARTELEKISAQVATLIDLFGDGDAADTATLVTQLGNKWDDAQAAIDDVFGVAVATLARETDSDDAADAFDDVVQALSSLDAFQAATAKDGEGVFESAELSADAAADAFDAIDSQATATLGMLGDTRFGAVVRKQRANARGKLEYGYTAPKSGELGAFAYATIDDTVRTHHIQTSGNAYYAGGTRAVGGDATLYSGDFEMQVRFRSEKVSGLVSNLQDSDGRPWQFKYGDVDSIILPEADLGPSANWNKTTGGMAQITFAPRAGSPQPQQLMSKFGGTLLGTGTAAGEQAVGTWSVGANPGEGSEYLAGGFGAARVDDAPTTLPASDDGTMTETMVSPVTGQTLADGMLTLVGTKRGAAEAVGTRTEEDKFEISLATMFGTQDANSWTNGANQVDLARAEIERLMSQLNAFIALDNDDATAADTLLANTNRAEIWVSVNTTIERYLFNNSDYNGDDKPVLDETDSANATTANWGTMQNNGYPVSSGGNALDSEALAEIQDVLDALASQAALEDALDENGVFENLHALTFNTDGTSATYRAVGDIWGRRESRVQWRLSSTEYTRFGVWRKQNNEYARNGYDANNNDDADGPGRLAYSPLAQTSYASHLDPSYPDGGVATYTGETLAIQNADFYMGTIAVRVEWAAGSVGGELAAVISDLENVGNGDPLLYAVAATDKRAIREIVFATDVDAVDGKLSFQDNTAADITYFAATGLTTAASTAASLQGKFVGQDIDGPLGVIGTWTLKGADDDDDATGQIGNNAHMIHGAFGAEVGP